MSESEVHHINKIKMNETNYKRNENERERTKLRPKLLGIAK